MTKLLGDVINTGNKCFGVTKFEDLKRKWLSYVEMLKGML